MSEPMLPTLNLNLDALTSNISTMMSWCQANGVELAPHVKTTMCRPIIELQAASGCQTMTVATVDQAERLIGWGFADVLIANQVVDSAGLSRMKAWMVANPDLRVRCFVDSMAGLEACERVFGEAGPALEVLVDVGTPGGRTGLRTADDALDICRRVASSSALRLGGVAGFEGVIPNSRDPLSLNAIDTHCQRVRDVYLGAALLFETDTPTFSMGGSAFPDRVVRWMPTATDVPGTVRLLRSGCYVSHDHGTYEAISPIFGLEAALSVRAVVLSVPEPGFAVVGAGRRDLAFDAGMPVLLSAWTSAGAPIADAAGEVSHLFDHHAVITQARDLAVTDVVDLGISHPCSVFDRWTQIVVTDQAGRALDVWTTNFERGSHSRR